jgi:hypothetical protein
MSVQSEILLPELMAGNAKPDVIISFGNVPENLEKPAFSTAHFQVSPDKFLLKIDGVAWFLIENGNKITIDPTEGGSEEEIRLFLLGSAFGALIHQRGMLPLHGSAIIAEGKAIIFSGISGIGKSTLAAAFIKKGYKLLADDVSVVTINISGKPIVHPGYPQMKLWTDALEKLGHKPLHLKKIRSKIKKYALPLQVEFHSKAAELNRIYIITKKEIDRVKISQLKGIEKFNTVKNNIYRIHFMQGAGTSEAHFKLIETISRLCVVKLVSRPSKGFHLEELMQIIKNDMTP